jgi:putative membrane protein
MRLVAGLRRAYPWCAVLLTMRPEDLGDQGGASPREEGDALGAARRTELAGERTDLAGERTQLAWWRTGLTAIAVGVGVGRVLPELGSHTHWPYPALGAAYALYGVACIGIAARHTRPMTIMTAAGIVLGLATAALVIGDA